MNKFLQKLAKLLLGLSMAAGVGVAVSAGRKDASPVHADSYVLTFQTASDNNPSGTYGTSTTSSTIFSAGASYVSSVSSSSRAYGPGTNGLKLGASSNGGNITFVLANSVTPTSIVVNGLLYNSSKAATLSVNSSTAQSLSGSANDYTFNITSEISSITLTASKYIWVTSITVYYSAGSTTNVTRQIYGPNNMSKVAGDASVDIASSISIEDESPASGYSVGSSETSVVSVTNSTTLNFLAAGTTTITISKASHSETDGGNTTNYSYTSHTFTVTVSLPELELPDMPSGNYELITSKDDVVSGYYLIVNGSSAFKASAETLDSSSNSVTATDVDGVISTSSTLNENVVYLYALGDYSFYILAHIGSEDGYVYMGNATNSNGLYQSQTVQYTNTLVSISDSGVAKIQASGSKFFGFTSSKFRYYAETNANVKLYKKVNGYTVTKIATNCTIAGNDVIGDSADATFTVTPSSGYDVPTVITVQRGSTTLTAGTNYTYTVSNNVGTLTIPQAQITGNFTITAAGIQTYTVTYNANTSDSVSGMPDPSTISNIAAGSSHTISDATPTRVGYIFDGWSTVSGDNNASGKVTGSITVNSDVPLYAIWVVDTTPTLSIDIESYSGYTGEEITITATYAYLQSNLAWSASGTGSISGGSITWSSDDHTNGSSTYTCTLSGEGGKTIVADATGVVAAQCVITITQTTVDITKVSTSISVGKSETLVASHNASSVGGLIWTSSDTNNKITVDSSGKVTVASNATVGSTATITATSAVDSGVSDTCTVTVAAAPVADEITLATTGITSTSYSSGDFSGKSATNTGHTAAVYAGQVVKSSNGYIQMRATNPGGIVSTGSGGKVRGVTVTWDTSAMASNARTLDIYCNTSAYSSAADLYSTSTDGDKVGSISYTDATTYNTYLSISGDYTYIGLRSNNGAMYIQEIDIEWELPNELSSVSVSFASDPADRTFYAGSNFAFNGTLTASYTVDSPKAVTPSGYFLEGEEGTGDQITTSTILTVADHNGGEVYVQYKEGGVTKYDTFILIVNPAPATSVTLSANVGSVALEEVFEVSSITATVQPSAYATQGVTWDIYDLDGLTSSDYDFDNGEFMASKPADVVFHVKANSNTSVYAVFTLSITGDPIAHLLDGELADVTNGSASVFADAGTLTYGVTTENFEGTITYTWSTSNSSIISIDDEGNADMCDFLVETAGSARLSCQVEGSTKGNVTVYIDVTVTAVSVTSVTWNAPTIDVFSGTAMSTTGWNVKYSTNSGKTDQTPESYKIFLGGTEIPSNHVWSAADDGKELCVKIGNVSSSTTSVAVTQSINAVTASLTNSWDYTFPSKQWSTAGDWTLDEKLWTMSGTDDGSPFFGYDATKGQQFGSGTHPFSDVSLQSSAFSGTIDSVTVYTSGANSINATVQVSVGGTAYGSAKTITNTNTAYKFDLGGKSGTISIDYVNSSSKAIYIKEIVVNTVSSSQNIANNDDHKAAQRAAVAFAQAFNAAMDDTENCTTGLDAAWSTCSSAYTTFKSTAKALGETEEAWAFNLVKYATKAYSDDSGEACLERMMKTYETIVRRYGDDYAFMSDLVTISASSGSPLVNIIGENTNTVAIIVIISMVSVTAIGGYFFIRKRKEQ